MRTFSRIKIVILQSRAILQPFMTSLDTVMMRNFTYSTRQIEGTIYQFDIIAKSPRQLFAVCNHTHYKCHDILLNIFTIWRFYIAIETLALTMILEQYIQFATDKSFQQHTIVIIKPYMSAGLLACKTLSRGFLADSNLPNQFDR